MHWDIFCKVIDNHGDIGVCWRLAADLARRGEAVRLWVDDASALQWMAPGGRPGVAVLPWPAQASADPGDVVIEAFGCELEPAFQAALARRSRADGRQPAWLNLEYLTAESFARRSHRLPSPVLAGPAAGLTKYFFYPGFTPDTGGLLREPDLLQRQLAFDREGWLRRHDIVGGEHTRLVSLFCYEPAGLPSLLELLARERVHLLVTAGRASDAVRRALASAKAHPAITSLPLLTQEEFDGLLWACDLNFVRGEDSLVRALWAGRPFVWQLYPQADGAHHAKLDAFLGWLQPPASLEAFHRFWNGQAAAPGGIDLDAWHACARAGRERLLDLPDLTSSLLEFVAGQAPSA